MIKNSGRRQAYLFGVVLSVFVFTTIIIAFMSAGPIVLGTELNTNGGVEYLCLGNGCENLLQMDF